MVCIGSSRLSDGLGGYRTLGRCRAAPLSSMAKIKTQRYTVVYTVPGDQVLVQVELWLKCGDDWRTDAARHALDLSCNTVHARVRDHNCQENRGL